MCITRSVYDEDLVPLDSLECMSTSPMFSRMRRGAAPGTTLFYILVSLIGDCYLKKLRHDILSFLAS